MVCPTAHHRISLANDISEENTEVPVRIGSGSFATVFTAAGSSFAVKICHSAEDTQVDDLLKEFECLKDIFQHCQPAYFKAPRPLAYFNPTAADFKFCEEPPSVINSIRIPAIRPSVDLFDIYGIETAGYAMQRVHPVPLAASRFIKKAFLPEGYQNDASVHLCRLYFGKILKPSRFVNLTNFQLDRDRYLKLQQALSQAYLPDPEELCFEMGYTLGVIHWDCRYDGRDIEFVLGGDGVSGLRFHVLDFNQVASFRVFLTLSMTNFIHRCASATRTSTRLANLLMLSFRTTRISLVRRMEVSSIVSFAMDTCLPTPKRMILGLWLRTFSGKLKRGMASSCERYVAEFGFGI